MKDRVGVVKLLAHVRQLEDDLEDLDNRYQAVQDRLDQVEEEHVERIRAITDRHDKADRWARRQITQLNRAVAAGKSATSIRKARSAMDEILCEHCTEDDLETP